MATTGRQSPLTTRKKEDLRKLREETPVSVFQRILEDLSIDVDNLFKLTFEFFNGKLKTGPTSDGTMVQYFTVDGLNYKVDRYDLKKLKSMLQDRIIDLKTNYKAAMLGKGRAGGVAAASKAHLFSQNLKVLANICYSSLARSEQVLPFFDLQGSQILGLGSPVAASQVIYHAIRLASQSVRQSNKGVFLSDLGNNEIVQRFEQMRTVLAAKRLRDAKTSKSTINSDGSTTGEQGFTFFTVSTAVLANSVSLSTRGKAIANTEAAVAIGALSQQEAAEAGRAITAIFDSAAAAATLLPAYANKTAADNATVKALVDQYKKAEAAQK